MFGYNSHADQELEEDQWDEYYRKCNKNSRDSIKDIPTETPQSSKDEEIVDKKTSKEFGNEDIFWLFKKNLKSNFLEKDTVKI